MVQLMAYADDVDIIARSMVVWLEGWIKKCIWEDLK